MQPQVNDLISANDPLMKLVQKENFVGWLYAVDYDSASLMTNDLWKAEALGIPHNAFLVAASFDPDRFTATLEVDREVLLLRVVGSDKLPQNDDLVRTKIDHFQRQTGAFEDSGLRDYDDLTLNQLQFGGLACRVLGSFYIDEGVLKMGSDLESFSSSGRLRAYRPRGEALRLIANYVDPSRAAVAENEARLLGLQGLPAPFRIGTVRYTSSARLHRRDAAEQVPVHIQPSDFLARRSAVFGMTRTGKSNMVKQTVAVVRRVAGQAEVPIGQVIYDVNGEYANANQQDQGAIADVFPRDTVRYRMLPTPGFEDLRTNFYLQVSEGFGILRALVAELKPAGHDSADFASFLEASFDEPDPQDTGERRRWEVRVAIYHTILHEAGFPTPANFRVKFSANSGVRTAVDGSSVTGAPFPDPSRGLTFQEARDWFVSARAANQANRLMSSGSNAKPWLDEVGRAMLNVLARRNDREMLITGYRVVARALAYHSERREQDVVEEIYSHLRAGRIVILDLSVGSSELRERLSKQIASGIFHNSMQLFIAGELPPNIMLYIEEAHNLIGRGSALTDIWPRLAKEGAKYRIGLVYATQEISSIHPNILANTENWFVTHINNRNEIHELSRFYDFEDFSRSLLRAQDVGFARIKTLSSPFVIPVQIDRFDPALAGLGASGG